MRDARLFGFWKVQAIDITGKGWLRADPSTTASLRFRRDGLLLVNGERCGASHFRTASGRLLLRWPAQSSCYFGALGTRLALRIEDTLDTLMGRPPLTYAVRAGNTLTVAANGYRVRLVRGQPPEQARTSLGPSSPVPYSGTATT